MRKFSLIFLNLGPKFIYTYTIFYNYINIINIWKLCQISIHTPHHDSTQIRCPNMQCTHKKCIVARISYDPMRKRPTALHTHSRKSFSSRKDCCYFAIKQHQKTKKKQNYTTLSHFYYILYELSPKKRWRITIFDIYCNNLSPFDISKKLSIDLFTHFFWFYSTLISIRLFFFPFFLLITMFHYTFDFDSIFFSVSKSFLFTLSLSHSLFSICDFYFDYCHSFFWSWNIIWH